MRNLSWKAAIIQYLNALLFTLIVYPILFLIVWIILGIDLLFFFGKGLNIWLADELDQFNI